MNARLDRALDRVILAIPKWFAERMAHRHNAILDALTGQELSGLPLCKAVGRGPGSLYPDLELLAQAGLVTSRWGDRVFPDGPRRRLYRRAGAA